MTMRTYRITIAVLAILLVTATDMIAGGPWTQKPGKARLTFGFSRKTAGTRWRDGVLQTPADSTLVGGLFHDFQYAYLYGEIGIVDNLELSGTINYLFGYESVGRDPSTNLLYKDPVTGKSQARWELNQGFTDSWLNLKYQVMHGDYPIAVMVSTRFPDLYAEPGDVYTRYQKRTYTVAYDSSLGEGKDTVLRVSKTSTEATSEWRGVLKRDLGIHVLAGHSFGSDGYIETMLAYNFRQGAFADQVLFSIDGGYNFPVMSGWNISPKLLFDYTGGLGNGGIPDSSDRFGGSDSRGLPAPNVYFNNGRYGRLYGSVGISSDQGYGLDLGVGSWIFGNGAAKYLETYAQVSYQF
jgi:hypothetical protein